MGFRKRRLGKCILIQSILGLIHTYLSSANFATLYYLILVKSVRYNLVPKELIFKDSKLTFMPITGYPGTPLHIFILKYFIFPAKDFYIRPNHCYLTYFLPISASTLKFYYQKTTKI